MSNRGLLAVILVIVVGIFAIVTIQLTEPTPAEKIGNSVSEAIEEVGDEVDDATTN